MKIGFVGLGAMGLPMAMNLVKGGHDVTGFDLSADALAELEKAGGTAGASGAAAAEGADLVVTMCRTDTMTGQTTVIDSGRVFH